MPDTTTALTEYQEFASRYYVGAGSFHESYFVSELRQDRTSIHHRPWGDFHARFLRYSTFWAHYENNVYRRIHRWAEFQNSSYDLYAFIRSIFSPAYRTIEFWATHILGGNLDPDAGDGLAKPSALPILTDNPAIRPVIAQVWRDSNWQAKKEILARFGAAMGDAAVMAVDDEAKRKIQQRVVDPRTLRDVRRDCFGNVKAYIIQEQRIDPEARTIVGQQVYATYTEVCEKVGNSIRYATFRNGKPYDWRDYDEGTPDARRTGVEWTEEYDFVPLVYNPHRDMGLDWGWGELQPTLSKLHELDDLASKLDDWIRIAVDSPWLFTGVLPPGSGVANDPLQCELMVVGDGESPKGRERMLTMTSNNPNTRAQPLIAPLDIASTSAHIMTILQGIKDDHPELLADDVGAAASGEARKVAREKVEAMVLQRRAGYDDMLVRVHAMAITMGAIKEYPGFEGFTADSFKDGMLAHSIGPRPVFAIDEMARIQESAARAAVVKQLVDAGISRPTAMKQAGFSDQEIKDELASKLREDDAAQELAQRRQAFMFQSDLAPAINGNGNGNGNGFAAQ